MQLPIAAGRTWTGGRRGPYLNDNSVMLAQRIPIAGARSGTVYRGAKNIPRKGPQNCRSLHGTPGQVGFARDDKEKGRDSVSKSPLKSLSSPSEADLSRRAVEGSAVLRAFPGNVFSTKPLTQPGAALSLPAPSTPPLPAAAPRLLLRDLRSHQQLWRLGHPRLPHPITGARSELPWCPAGEAAP